MARKAVAGNVARIVLLALALLALAPVTPAFALLAIHMPATKDTDQCAACHRAHTSFSPVKWADQLNPGNPQHSALLVGSAQTMYDFCQSCHGDLAPGASTNVQSGIFDAGPSADWQTALSQAIPGGTSATSTGGSASVGGTQSAALLYSTASAFDATLNGGGFERMPAGAPGAQTYKPVTSLHNMDGGNQFGKFRPLDFAWGKGNSVSQAGLEVLVCTDCHDPHGGSNYRLLNGRIGSHQVGGYDANNVPDAYVVSNEWGFPAAGPNPGFMKYEAGAAQAANYLPNYTTAQYANPFSSYGKSMSVWCAACHEQYINTTSAWDYEAFEGSITADFAAVTNPVFSMMTTRPVPTVSVRTGSRIRHRHPVDTSLGTGQNPWLFQTPTTYDPLLPLEASNPTNDSTSAVATEGSDMIGCLTCHRAHGTSAVMSGWAEAYMTTRATRYVGDTSTWYPALLSQPTTSGVSPNFSGSLLRVDNRGVCERCHNK